MRTSLMSWPVLSGAVLLIASAVPTVTQAQATFEPVAPGVEFALLSARSGRDTIKLHVVRVNPRTARLRIVGVYRTLQAQPGAYGYSLNEVVEATRPVAAINGGFSTSFSVPLPAGLLRTDGSIVGRLSTTDSVLSGVLCMRDARVSVVRRDLYRSADCLNALQAGPLLVDRPGTTLNLNNLARARVALRRSVVALDQRGRVLLIATSRVRLDSLAVILIRDPNLGAVVALNLSGGSDSGLFVRRPEGTVTAGTPHAPIASAIVVR